MTVSDKPKFVAPKTASNKKGVPGIVTDVDGVLVAGEKVLGNAT
jgi:hypothetical protein